MLGVLLAAGGFAFAATQEQHDPFCASCHTQPESTFYQRSLAAQPVDLAAAHKLKNVTCINCHSGVGVTGRMSAELMGARNAALWYSGRATQPAPLTLPIGDANCLKCHQDVTGSRSRNNHFHYFLLALASEGPAGGYLCELPWRTYHGRQRGSHVPERCEHRSHLPVVPRPLRR